MTKIAQLLQKKAQSLNLHPNEPLTPAGAFALVREMPYQRASDRQVATIVEEWRGTCSGKHYLLQAVLTELGVESDLIAAPAYVAVQPEHVPEELGKILREGPVPDVHNYLRLPWIVDATWPLASAEYGVPVNPEWVEGEDMLLPCEPLHEYVVPSDRDAQDYKNELLARHFSEEELERRVRFFGALAGNG